VVLTGAGLRQRNNFVAVPGLVIIAFSFGTIRVSNVVGVILFELFSVNIMFLDHFSLPEREGLLHIETHSLEEKTKLQTAVMLEMVVLFQNLVQSFHTRGERLPRVVVQVCQAHPLGVRWCLHLKNVKVNCIVVRQS